MKLQLVYFTGCPHADAARTALRDALAAEALDVAVEEIASSACCRLYPTGAPGVQQIRDRLRAARDTASPPPHPRG